MILSAIDSGLVVGLGYVVEDMMITVCWTGSNVEGFIKTLKFVELTASNMLAITNLAICVNLALIIMVSDLATSFKSKVNSLLYRGYRGNHIRESLRDGNTLLRHIGELLQAFGVLLQVCTSISSPSW